MFRSATDHRKVITSQHSTVLVFVKYVDCFEVLYVKIRHIYTTTLKKSLHSNHLTLLHHVSVEKSD